VKCGVIKGNLSKKNLGGRKENLLTTLKEGANSCSTGTNSFLKAQGGRDTLDINKVVGKGRKNDPSIINFSRKKEVRDISFKQILTSQRKVSEGGVIRKAEPGRKRILAIEINLSTACKKIGRNANLETVRVIFG